MTWLLSLLAVQSALFILITSAQPNNDRFPSLSADSSQIQSCPPCQISRDNLFVNLTVSSVRLMDDLLIVPSNRRLYILVLLPLHDSAVDNQCGSIQPQMFETLVALLHELATLNADRHLLPELKIGALVVDTCGSELRAIADLFELFINRRDMNDIRQKDLLAVVHYDYPMPVSLNQLLNQLDVPRINLAPTLSSQLSVPLVAGLQPTVKTLNNVLTDIFLELRWTQVNYVHEDSPLMLDTPNEFEFYANSKGICVDQMLKMGRWASLHEAQMIVRRLVLSRAQVVVLAVSELNVQLLMSAMHLENISPGRFILVSSMSKQWLDKEQFLTELEYFQQGWFWITPSSMKDDKFRKAINILSPENRGLIPPRWLDQYWQAHFRCNFGSNHKHSTNKYSRTCRGYEQLNITDLPFEANAMKIGVRALAMALDSFRRTECPGVPMSRLSDCLSKDTGAEFARKLQTVNVAYPNDPPRTNVRFDRFGFPQRLAHDLLLFDRKSKNYYEIEKIGAFVSNSIGDIDLELNATSVFVRDSRGDRRQVESRCSSRSCAACGQIFGEESQNNDASSFGAYEYEEVRYSASSSLRRKTSSSSIMSGMSTSTIAVCVVAGLIMLVCVVCAFSFRHTLAPCGFMVIVGLILVCLLSIVYAFEASKFVCAVRRLCPGVCWILVFAPCLVEAISQWGTHFARSSVGNASTTDSKTSPAALLIAASVLVAMQCLVVMEWAVLDPSGTTNVIHDVLYERETDIPILLARCSPVEDYELTIAMSMVLVIVIATLASLFAALAAQTNGPRNLHHASTAVACAVVVFSWLVWTFSARAVDPTWRNTVTACVFLSDVVIILIGMFLCRACQMSFNRKHPELLEQRRKKRKQEELGRANKEHQDHKQEFDEPDKDYDETEQEEDVVQHTIMKEFSMEVIKLEAPPKLNAPEGDLPTPTGASTVSIDDEKSICVDRF